MILDVCCLSALTSILIIQQIENIHVTFLKVVDRLSISHKYYYMRLFN